MPGMAAHVAWNTAVSFVTNTNWQAYSGESTLGHLVQMAGLAVQNFVSAARRHRGRRRADPGLRRPASPATLGNFWVDLTRITLRILLPVCVLVTIVFMVAGMVQNLSGGTDVTTLTGATQHITGGPVASQEAIKELGTNGGGFYNVNSAHPFENPTAWTNWLQIFLLLVIPFSLPRVFGRMVGQTAAGLRDRRGHGACSGPARVALTTGPRRTAAAPCRRRSARRWRARRSGSAIRTQRTFAVSTTRPRPGR